MSLSKNQVQYILAKFDAGVPTHRIPMGFQSAHLPSADIDTVEQCLRENGRLQSNHYRAGYYAAIWANQPPPPPPPGGVGRGSNNPPGPANQRPSTATPNPSAQTSAGATNDLVVAAAAANLGPPSNGTLRRTTSPFPPTDLGNRRR